MLRAFLVASPLVLALVSCGDSATSFDESTLPGGTSAGATGGTDGTGATDNMGGSSASSAGKSSGAGTTSTAGSENGSAGTKNTNGGTGNNGGTSNTGGTKNTGGNSGTGNESGSTNNGGGGSGNGAGTGGTDTGGTAGTDTGGTAGTAGTSGSGGSAAGNGGTAGSGAACPDVFGQYDIVNLQGACNGVNKDAPQSIQGTAVACAAHFVSIVPQGNPGVNGGAELDANGDFNGTTLYFGKSERKPCNGTWNAVDERMTVQCVVQNETCTVTMDRK
jgi:hypothetical protein